MKFERRRHALLLALSHPTGVRGLKSSRRGVELLLLLVAPHWGAWIEILRRTEQTEYRLSHPTGVRGLKYRHAVIKRTTQQSHPTGVRGLKYALPAWRPRAERVAPHWGAWIEISPKRPHGSKTRSRTPLGCVD